MATWNDLFSKEVCKCGRKGDYVVSNGKGRVVGFECESCHKK